MVTLAHVSRCTRGRDAILGVHVDKALSSDHEMVQATCEVSSDPGKVIVIKDTYDIEVILQGK